ncbi:MAG: Flagellar hook capping protein - N-terminal region, partial [Candidatus Eremiobacteraeota bacterium]|nr:Flagellar hook capping protein - N-terminal region [Candidatus Eremiobacteraeota bacterium]
MASVTGLTGGLPIDGLISKTQTAAQQASSLGSQLGQDAFLKLLTTQLRNQDPLHPMDDTQS